ncbi:hypothetical protein [Sulfuritalea sp.]|uniref:hypothetical protein n=1 Tax=Sulfuritalea sp. TaxID=2480090 RepID=UPI00286E0616|nr:hypothetical protein [Sulfuritalea sp.]
MAKPKPPLLRPLLPLRLLLPLPLLPRLPHLPLTLRSLLTLLLRPPLRLPLLPRLLLPRLLLPRLLLTQRSKSSPAFGQEKASLRAGFFVVFPTFLPETPSRG